MGTSRQAEVSLLLIFIPAWSKYNPRKDIKNPSWFRLDRDFYLDSEMMTLPTETRFLWVVLMGMATKGRGDPFRVTESTLAFFVGTTSKNIQDGLKELGAFGKILIESEALPDANGSVRMRTYALPDGRTDGRDERTNDILADSPTAEFGVNDLIIIWNQNKASSQPEARAAKKGTRRFSAAAARIREEPDPGYWIGIVKRMSSSPFLRGEVGGWVATFDFLVRPDTHTKVLEGNYDARARQQPGQLRIDDVYKPANFDDEP